MRKLPPLLALLIAFALIVTMQNCGSFKSQALPVDEYDATSPTRPTDLSTETPLLCSNLPPDNPDKINVEERVRAAGRISLDTTRWGFVTKAGRVFMGFADGNVTERDAGTLYQWFDFAVNDPCGITVSGVVRCQGFSGTGFTDVPQLAGSIQVRSDFPNGACGLQAGGGILRCVTKSGTVTTVAAPEEILLMTEHAFYARSGKQYWYAGGLEFIDSPIPESYLLNSKKVPTSSTRHITLCNQDIGTSGFAGTGNYGEARGCAITTGGRLFCVGSRHSAPNQRELVSVDANGDYSRELKAISPTEQYLAVTQFSGGSLACAIRRDLEAVCFTTEFEKRRSSFEDLFTVNPIVKSAFTIPQPETVTASIVNEYKGCVLKSGVVSCWRNPAIEYGTGVLSAPYVLISANPIVSFAGFINHVDSTKGFYSRACMLDTTGALLCEPIVLNNSSRTLVQQDPGVQWSSIEFQKTQPSKSCGLTVNGELRCTKDYSGNNLDFKFETIGTGVAFLAGETLIMNDGRYGGTYRLESNILRTATSMRFASAIPGHPYLFRGTDGKIYGANSSDSWAEVSPAAFASVEQLLNVGGLHYFDRTNKRCPYLGATNGGVTDRACAVQLYTETIPNADVAFAAMADGIYIKPDGSVHSRTVHGSSALRFIPPTVMTPR
jgi:hypothetical protein